LGELKKNNVEIEDTWIWEEGKSWKGTHYAKKCIVKSLTLLGDFLFSKKNGGGGEGGGIREVEGEGIFNHQRKNLNKTTSVVKKIWVSRNCRGGPEGLWEPSQLQKSEGIVSLKQAKKVSQGLPKKPEKNNEGTREVLTTAR